MGTDDAAPEAPLEGDRLPEWWEPDVRSAINVAFGQDDGDDGWVDFVTDVLAAIEPHALSLRAGQRGTDRLRGALAADVALVAEGRAFTRENFPVGNPGKFVGHTPADDFYAAIDRIIAALAVADSPRIDPATFSTNGGAWVADSPQEPSNG